MEVQRAIKEEKERNGKEGAKRQEEAVMKEVEGSREEGRRRKAEDSDSRGRRREEEDTTAKSVVLGRKSWSGNRQGERRGCKGRIEGLEGREEEIGRIEERRGGGES